MELTQERDKSVADKFVEDKLSGDLTHYAFFPLQHPELYQYYAKQKSVFWVAEEIDYVTDRSDWDRLDEKTKEYVRFLLFLFAQLDGIVNENLVDNLKKETSFSKECSMFYSLQETIEWTHNETYSNLIMALIRDPEEQRRGLNSIQHYPEIKAIAAWAFRWMTSDIPLLQRLIAFACIEGIVFSSAFAGIYWIKKKNVLRGLTQANEWIARDENYHTEFPVALYHVLTSGRLLRNGEWLQALEQRDVHAIISSAVEVTESFTRGAMRNELVGLSSDDMVAYVKSTADHLSRALGYEAIYKIPNPLDWMVIISLPNKTNFFEKTVTEYARHTESDFTFDLDADF